MITQFLSLAVPVAVSFCYMIHYALDFHNYGAAGGFAVIFVSAGMGLVHFIGENA